MTKSLEEVGCPSLTPSPPMLCLCSIVDEPPSLETCFPLNIVLFTAEVLGVDPKSEVLDVDPKSGVSKSKSKLVPEILSDNTGSPSI